MVKRKEDKLLIAVKDLSWGYPKSPLLFEKFNFALYENDFSVIVGESAKGKSSLAKLITGHIKCPAKSIYHKLEDLSKFSASELQKFRRNLGMVFQKDYLIKTLSIKENILYPLKLQGIDYGKCETKYRDIVKYLKIKHLEEKKIEELSGWELQKIFIARALIHSPEFIVIDDALSNLDKKSKEQILDLLMKYHSDGHTILMITHDQETLNYLEKNINLVVKKI